jgi:4-hydroxy-tetrahydrodipicolinate synthase
MKWQGSYVAIVTPFRDDKIDAPAYRRLIEFQIESGTSGIVPCGTTGESATLTHAEHAELIRLTMELVGGRVPVIAGTGSNSTREALGLTAEAQKAGADAALLITPYYNKPSQQGLYEHYKAIAEAVDIPLVLYNVPGRTGVSLAPTTVFRLAELKNVVAVKDATGSMDWTSEVIGGCDLAVLSGDDSATLPMIALGATGVISVLANVAPGMMADLVRMALDGDWVGARQLHHRYFKLMKALFLESNPMPVKAALEMMGLIGPEIRPPLTPISEGTRTQLRDALTRLGLL